MTFRRVLASVVLGLAACARPGASTPPQTVVEAEPSADSAVRTPDVDVATAEPEPKPEASAELDPSLLAPALPEEYQTTLSWEQGEPARGKSGMVLRTKVLRGKGPDRVRGIRVTLSSRGAVEGDGASSASFREVRLRVLAAPGVRFVGGTGMVVSSDRSGVDAKFENARPGARRDIDILFVADEGLVGKHPVATVSLEYTLRGGSPQREQKKVFATLR